MAPDPQLGEAVRRVLGRRVVGWRRVEGGWTAAGRWIAALADGRAAFVKAATDDLTAGWLRKELGIYESVQAGFLPRFLGWDEGPLPVLLLEDLSGAFWPPPWTPERIGQVFRLMQEVRDTVPPEGLPRFEGRGFPRVGCPTWRGGARLSVAPRG